MNTPNPAHAIAAAEVRRRIRPHETDGGLWLVFFGPTGAPVLTLTVDEGVRHVDVLFRRHLVDLVRHVDAHALVLAVSRPDGRPQRVERRLWQHLLDRLREDWPHRIDLLVVGPEQTWAPLRCRAAA